MLFHGPTIASVLFPVPGSTEVLLKLECLPHPHALPWPHCSQWVCPAHTFLHGAPLVASGLDLSYVSPWSCWSQWAGPGPRIPCSPTKASSYVQSTQGMPLEFLALVALGACISGSQRTETIRETVLRLPRPGHNITDWHIPHSSYEKDLFTCPGASVWGADFRFTRNLETTKMLSGNEGQLCTLLWPHYSPPVPPKKEAYTLVWSPNFCNCCQKDTSKLPGLETRRGYNISPTGCIYLHTLKAAAWGSGFQSAWN